MAASATAPAGDESHGKGIILMHDLQHGTPEAMPELTKRGYPTIAEMKAKSKGRYLRRHART